MLIAVRRSIPCAAIGFGIGALAGWIDYVGSIGVRSYEALAPAMLLYGIGLALCALAVAAVRPWVPYRRRRHPNDLYPFVTAAVAGAASFFLLFILVAIRPANTTPAGEHIAMVVGLIALHMVACPAILLACRRIHRRPAVKILAILILLLGVTAAITASLYDESILEFVPNYNPNILLIVIDGLRSEHLKIYNPDADPEPPEGVQPGPDWSASPNIDKLAHAGVRFGAYQAPTTSTDGIRELLTGRSAKTTAAALPALLRAARYDTAIFSATEHIGPADSFGMGVNYFYAPEYTGRSEPEQPTLLLQDFLHYSLSRLQKRRLWDAGLWVDRLLRMSQVPGRSEPERVGPSRETDPDTWNDQAVKKSLLWLDRRRKSRFFAVVHLTHSGKVRPTDKWIMDLWTKIKEDVKQDNDTLIALIGLPGDGKNGTEPGEFPLIVRLPMPQFQALVEEISVAARAADLYPTLLEALQLPIPEDLPGRSLMPLLTGRASAEPSDTHDESQ